MHKEIESNKRKTAIILVVFFAFFGAFAWFTGSVVGLIFGVVYAAFSYYSSSKIALSMNGAKEIKKQDNPRLWRTVENIAITSGMPMPRLYIIQDNGFNAFATGRDPEHAHVAITSGLLEALDNQELQGVMAHEMGHVKNYDIRVSMVAFALVAAVSIIADFFSRMRFYGMSSSDDDAPAWSMVGFVFSVASLVLAPIIASLLQMALSRQREYLADATGAHTTRYPEGLASALEKIRDGGSILRRQNPSTAHFFIANPLKGKSISALFSTHPPIDERISRLRSMGL
jgi:heat shock protein HtpX